MEVLSKLKNKPRIQKYAGLWDFSVVFPSTYDWLCWTTQARMLTVVDALQVCDVCFVSVHNLLVQEKTVS